MMRVSAASAAIEHAPLHVQADQCLAGAAAAGFLSAVW